jgi:hypothetical protein
MLLSAGGPGEPLLASPAVRIAPEITKCLWRASLPTWAITGHYSFVSAVMVFTSLIVSTVNATASP